MLLEATPFHRRVPLQIIVSLEVMVVHSAIMFLQIRTTRTHFDLIHTRNLIELIWSAWGPDSQTVKLWVEST